VGGAGEEVVHGPFHGQLAVPVPVHGHHDGRRRLVQAGLVGAQRSLHRARSPGVLVMKKRGSRRGNRDGRDAAGDRPVSRSGNERTDGAGEGEEGRQRGWMRDDVSFLSPPALPPLSLPSPPTSLSYWPAPPPRPPCT
jgi:hypothetical protein